MARTLDHLAIVVASLEQAVPVWNTVLGVEGSEPTDVTQLGFRMVRYDLDNAWVALCEPMENSPTAAFLASKGEGIYGVIVHEDDADAAAGRVESAGVRILGARQPGGRVLPHPKDVNGVALQFVTATAAPAASGEET